MGVEIAWRLGDKLCVGDFFLLRLILSSSWNGRVPPAGHNSGRKLKQIHKTMKSPKTLIILAILGTVVGLRADNELELEQCPANVQETIRANARGGDADEVNPITDNVTLYWAEVDVPERREDLKLLIGSDGKLIKTREEIDLADAPTAVREAAAKLVPDGGKLEDGVDREVTDGKAAYAIEIGRPKAPGLDVLIAEDGTLINQIEDPED
jgi:hypothetical protein